MKFKGPRLRSWIRLFVVLLGIVIVMPHTYAAALKFADDTEPLAVDYKALAARDQRLQVIVVNNGSEEAEVTGQILLLGLKSEAQTRTDESPLILRKDDPRGLTIAPGGAIILEFVPNPHITPAQGRYTGRLIVFDVRSHDAITKPVEATVSGGRSYVTITKEAGLQKAGPTNPVKAPVEIVGSNTPRYDYKKLVDPSATKERIRVAVRNTGTTTQQLSGRRSRSSIQPGGPEGSGR